MAEVAAHVTDHVLPHLPVRQWVLSVPKRLRPFVEVAGEVDRRAWECALLLRLRDEIRSGNVSVNHGKRFGRLDDFFVASLR